MLAHARLMPTEASLEPPVPGKSIFGFEGAANDGSKRPTYQPH